MGGGAMFTESWIPAKACDPTRAASTGIRNIVSLFFIFNILHSSLFVMRPGSRLIGSCLLTLRGSGRIGFVPSSLKGSISLRSRSARCFF